MVGLSKVVIFGAWQEGVSLYFEIRKKVEVVAFIDNNPNIQSQKLYGIEILSPDNLNRIEYDEVYISSTKRFPQMYLQLSEMGVDKEKIKIVYEIGKMKTDIDKYGIYLEDKIEEFEKKWYELQEKYKKIQIHSLDVSCIGETVPRLCRIIEEESTLDRSILRIFLPVIGSKMRVCNEKLIELASEKINMVSASNIDFWKYILDVHSSEIETINYTQYLYKGEWSNCFVQKNYSFISFREDQIEFGKRKLTELGISGEYVCMIARTPNYAKSTLKNKGEVESNIAIHGFRDSDFYEYRETIDYFKTINVKAVRMGRGEEPITDIDNCIDYAGGNADDFMDIFLLANCKLMIVGGGTGVHVLATSFGRPVLSVNLVPVMFGHGGNYLTENDLYIPKKMMFKDKDRYLSLREMADYDKRSLHNGVLYDKNGIKFIDNTSTEILEATKEILDRINGKWEDTEEDVKLLQQYESILKTANHSLKKDIYRYHWGGGAIPVKISVSYLKKNLYLLED